MRYNYIKKIIKFNIRLSIINKDVIINSISKEEITLTYYKTNNTIFIILLFIKNIYSSLLFIINILLLIINYLL